MPTANSIAALYSIVPRHSVATQLKIFTPVGTAISKLESMKKVEHHGRIGAENMWCAHTSSERNAIAGRRRRRSNS